MHKIHVDFAILKGNFSMLTKKVTQTIHSSLLTFIAVTLFYAFESAQMAYYNVLAPTYISLGYYQQSGVAAISAAYFYGTMAGLFPMGYLLDHFSLRKIILFGLIGSVCGVVLLTLTHVFYLQWLARFICGFFGGTTCFLGGIRIIALVYPRRFSYYMGIFLAAGMFGGMICQYPLLIMVKHFGTSGALRTVLATSVLTLLFNFIFLKPSEQVAHKKQQDHIKRGFWKTFQIIVFTPKNWCDVIMVSLLDTPVSIIGTLWGVVFFTSFFHFGEVASSLIVMSMFLGLILGLPIIGHIADERKNPPSIVLIGAIVSLLIVLAVALLQNVAQVWMIVVLFFGLGFFSSCQTMGFTWITQGFQKDLIGRNSAFNSMVFMGTNGLFKQLGALLLATPSLFIGNGPSANLMLALAAAMFVSAIYASIRSIIFRKQLQASK